MLFFHSLIFENYLKVFQIHQYEDLEMRAFLFINYYSQ